MGTVSDRADHMAGAETRECVFVPALFVATTKQS